jgi:hypothetical protein
MYKKINKLSSVIEKRGKTMIDENVKKPVVYVLHDQKA